MCAGLRLLIVCGVPGAGKSTFAVRAAERWGAVRFASETFAEQLGAAARNASGDLTKEAIVHAYSAMGAAAADALAMNKLVIAVGSFRSEDQRKRFRDIAESSGASATTLRVVCPVEIAVKRICARLALGERGPDETAIRQIANGLDGANDIDLVLTNDSSMEDFHCRIDAVLKQLVLATSAEGERQERLGLGVISPCQRDDL
jgi:predicted kinase